MLFGSGVMALDSAWGGLCALGLDWYNFNEALLGITFILGLPSYVCDIWIGSRVAVILPGLFIFRWIATCFAGGTYQACNPLRCNVLLIVGFGILQLCKLANSQANDEVQKPSG